MSHCGAPSPGTCNNQAECGHLMLLFGKEQQRNVPSEDL